MSKSRSSVFSILRIAFAFAMLCSSAEAARLEAGKGVANDRARGDGPNDVTFVTRGVESDSVAPSSRRYWR